MHIGQKLTYMQDIQSYQSTQKVIHNFLLLAEGSILVLLMNHTFNESVYYHFLLLNCYF